MQMKWEEPGSRFLTLDPTIETAFTYWYCDQRTSFAKYTACHNSMSRWRNMIRCWDLNGVTSMKTHYHCHYHWGYLDLTCSFRSFNCHTQASSCACPICTCPLQNWRIHVSTFMYARSPEHSCKILTVQLLCGPHPLLIWSDDTCKASTAWVIAVTVCQGQGIHFCILSSYMLWYLCVGMFCRAHAQTLGNAFQNRQDLQAVICTAIIRLCSQARTASQVSCFTTLSLFRWTSFDLSLSAINHLYDLPLSVIDLLLIHICNWPVSTYRACAVSIHIVDNVSDCHQVFWDAIP